MMTATRPDYGRASRRLRPLFVMIGALLLVASGCSASDDPPGVSAAATATGDITVFAAASLTGTFTEIGEAFEAANPGTSVTFNFAASSALARQISEGAPADVFASADQANMQKLTDESNADGEPQVFATNRLQIVAEAGNPRGIGGVDDLADPDLIVVTCSEEVPIGRYAAEVFAKAGVTVTPKSYEADVKAVVNKVLIGEADAGIVYATDVTAAGDKVTGVEIPDDLNVVATYPIAVTKASRNATTARAFVDFVSGDEGRRILDAAGFSGP